MEEKKYWLGFSVCPGIGPKKFALLRETFGSAERAWNAPEAELYELLGQSLSRKFISFQQSFSFEEYLTLLEKKQVSFLTLSEDAYPLLLKQSYNPPFVLYVKGNSDVLLQTPASLSQEQCTYVAMVGTRKITQYGRQVTELLTEELVAAGCVIVSGLALGVDACAHSVTVDCGGKTIAVLGCGVDCCAPRENTNIYNSIIMNGGAIVSEFPLGTAPSIGSFPSRNRIIAGLSHGVVVTEGAEDSGALITAGDAFKDGRHVFAVPGPITSGLSKGPYKLIQNGAKLITCGQDILQELGIKNHELRKEKKQFKGDTEDEQKIIDLLQEEGMHFDEIVRKTGMNSSQIGILLSFMEMKGLIRQNGGEYKTISL